MKQLLLLLLLGLSLISNPVNSQLNIMWESRFDNDSKDDFSKGIVIDNVGNSYIVGTSMNGTDFDVVAIKYDPDGNEIWNVSIVAPVSGYCDAVGIVLDSNNNPIIGGNYFNGGGDYDIFARKLLSLDGSTVWTYHHAGTDNFDELKDLTIDSNDNVILAGGTQENATDSRFVVISLTSSGTLAWEKSYNPTGGRNFANAVTVDAANNVYATGESYDATTKLDFYTVKYSSSGTQEWALRSDGNYATDRATSIVVALDGSVYIAGTSYRGLYLDDEIMLIKINTLGAKVWGNVFGGSDGSNDMVKSLAVDNNSHVYLAGSLKNIGNGEDFYVAKFRPNGSKHWDYTYQGPANGFDIANEIRISPNFDIYVAGTSSTSTTSNDYLTVKLDNLGNVKWIKRFDGPASKSDEMSGFQLDVDGNIFMTGASFGIGTLSDFSTIKYCQLETIASQNDTICVGASVQLGVIGGSNFQWTAFAGDPITSDNFSCTSCNDPIANPTMTTTYVVSSESASGCIDYDTVIIVVNPLPGPNITPNGPTSFCEGGSVNLSADPSTGYNWSTGDTTQTITVNAEGAVSLTVTDVMGCENSSTVNVEVYPIPEIDGGSDSFRCPGDSLLLNATGADTYVWHNLPSYSVSLQNGDYFHPTANSSLVVFGTSTDGCLGKDTIDLTLYPNPLRVQITQGFSGNLFSNYNQGTNYWSFDGVDTGITGPSFYYDTVIYCNGFYEVRYEDENGCKTYDSLTVSGETSCIEEEDTSNVKTNEMTQLELYPNPTRSQVYISFENTELRTISIYSMEGVLVSRVDRQEKDVVLDMTSLVNGTYMVAVEGKDSFARARVVKQ